MLLAALEQGVVLGAIGLALENPFLGEPPALDLLEDALHLLLGLIGDDAGPAGYVAILGRGADRVAHVGDAALVDQVHDQLHLMQALEIRSEEHTSELQSRLHLVCRLLLEKKKKKDKKLRWQSCMKWCHKST